MPIKLSSPSYGDLEIQAVTRVLQSQVTSMGQETYLFEQELKQFFGRDDFNVLAVNSCTAALQLALQGIGINPGDEVLVPTLTYVGTFQAVSAIGAIPIPCDVDNECFIDIVDAESRITSKTKAIIPVLYAGIDTNIKAVYKLADKYNLHVIEDVAHSFGSENIAKRNGIFCFSFDPIKNISCGSGGAIVSSDNTFTNHVKDLRLLGVIGDTERRINGERSWDFDVVEQGWRYHMGNLCAAIGRTQLSRIDFIKNIRCSITSRYMEELSGLKHIRLLPINYETAIPHIFPVLVEDYLRDDLKTYLLSKEIGCGVQYKPNHLLTYFKRGYSLPNAERLYEQLLSIPLHPRLSNDDVTKIIEIIKDWDLNI